MTTVTVYRSTDTSAPVLTGQAGSLTTLLDAVLVTGYNSNSPAGAGWTIAYTTTSKRSYRNSAVDGTGFYLNVDDTGTGNTAKEALMTGFEVMTAIATGTGQFPTQGQLDLNISATPRGCVMCRKSTTADATARAWTLIADNTCFYLFVETADSTSPTLTYEFAFGDIFSYRASDAYRCIIIGRNAVNSTQPRNAPLAALLNVGNASILSAQIIGHYMARSWTGAGGSVAVGKHIDQTKFDGAQGGSAGTGMTGTTLLNGASNYTSIGYAGNAPFCFPYPNGPDGGLYLSPIWVHHNSSVRGYMKGLWAPLHDRAFGHNDTFTGTGNMSGKSFLVQNLVATGNTNTLQGQIVIETSSTWS